jgi:Tol biopolymer transport system component
MLRLSPDGRRLAAVTDSALWLLDVDRGVSRGFTDNVRPMFPNWSQDGHTIFYLRSRASEIWRNESTSAAAGERIFTQANRTLTDWSRDGRFILFHTVGIKTLRDLWTPPPASPRRSPNVFTTWP